MRAFVIMAVSSMTTEASGQVTLLVSGEGEPPAERVLTASVAGSTAIAFDWGSLEAHPRCRGATCRVGFETPGCRRVEVAVTDLFGEQLLATTQVCVGEAPQASVELQVGAGATTVRLDSASENWARLWLDRAEVTPRGFLVPNDGACHAVDSVVIGPSGGVGMDRRTLCSPDAPLVWVGSAEAAPPSGGQRRLCLEAADPLGRELTTSESGCFTSSPVVGVTRTVVTASAGGLTSFASLITIPAEGIFELKVFELEVPEPRLHSRAVELGVFGGTPPFAALAVDDAGRELEVTTQGRTLRVTGVEGAVEVSVTDAKRRKVRARITPPGQPSFASAQSDSAGCSAAPGPTMSTLMILGLLMSSLGWRRRS
ncbi:MAG: hypothetical protein HY791_33315 [Deltaproteobacteria bacterium]|nr:hypothetical protein [Deltaproteobacteria bacterium]